MSESNTSEFVPAGFEAAHLEWVKRGGKAFRQKYCGGPDDSFYRSEYWILVRSAVLDRDGKLCFRCGGGASQVHHLTYGYTGEDHLHPTTLVSICRSCHGMIEYARKAEKLLSKLKSRISAYQVTTGRNDDIDERSVLHLLSQVLQYRDELCRMRTHFSKGDNYRNPKFTKPEDVARLQMDVSAYLRQHKVQAENELKSWSGTVLEKLAKIVSLLEETANDCEKFIHEVFKPIRRSSE